MSARASTIGHSAPPPERGADVYRSALNPDKRAQSGPSLLLAVALHLALVLAAVVIPKLTGSEPSLRKPVIARLVALGKPREKGMLPRKERPPPPPTASKGPVVPASDPLPPASSRPGKTMPVKRAPRQKRQPTRQELMQRALARVSGAVDSEPRDPKEKPEQREGQATGSPEGTAATAEAGEKYFTEVHDAILANYVVPSVISERERLYLKATLVAFIGPDGSLLKHQIKTPSGNALFDGALELALQKTKLPAPPAELSRSLRDDGVELNFKP